MAYRFATKPNRLYLVVLMALILLAGCSSNPTPTAVTLPPAEVETPAPQETATDVPTEAPTLTPRMLLIADPASSDPGQDERTEWLRSFADQNDLLFEVRPVLETSGLSEEVKLVVYLQPAGDISPLLAAAPQAQFVVVSSSGVQAGENLSVIAVDETQAAFLAGYITEMISPDFRAAGLFPDERSDLAEAFRNGAHYLCGRCVPVFAPVVFFPLIGTAPAGSSPNAWINAFDEVHKSRVEAVFLSAASASPDVIANLSQQGVVILSEGILPEEIRSSIAATIQINVDSALQTLLPDLLAGSGGLSLHAPLVLSDIDENRITPGKRQQIQQVIDDLSGGWIYPLSIPLE